MVYLNIHIKALSYKYGVYVAHFWPRIAWYEVRICWGGSFWRVCISMRLPYIQWYWKEHRTGKSVNAITLLKRPIFEIVIIKFQY